MTKSEEYIDKIKRFVQTGILEDFKFSGIDDNNFLIINKRNSGEYSSEDAKCIIYSKDGRELFITKINSKIDNLNLYVYKNKKGVMYISAKENMVIGYIDKNIKDIKINMDNLWLKYNYFILKSRSKKKREIKKSIVRHYMNDQYLCYSLLRILDRKHNKYRISLYRRDFKNNIMVWSYNKYFDYYHRHKLNIENIDINVDTDFKIRSSNFKWMIELFKTITYYNECSLANYLCNNFIIKEGCHKIEENGYEIYSAPTSIDALLNYLTFGDYYNILHQE